MLFVVPGVKCKVNTSDAGEPPEKCQAVDGEVVPPILPGTSQDDNGLLTAVPGTSQDGGAPPMTGQSTPSTMPVSGTMVHQSSDELQYALLGHTWGSGKVRILACAQRGMRIFIPV